VRKGVGAQADSSGGVIVLLLEVVPDQPDSGGVLVVTFDGISLDEG
jgi:hypothetical protein